MVGSRLSALLVIGTSMTLGALPAQAQAPGLYYAWRAMDIDMVTCLDRGTTALTDQELNNIQVEGNSVAGTTEESTAVFVCLADPVDLTDMTVMIMVSSTDDDVAFTLRETLKETF